MAPAGGEMANIFSGGHGLKDILPWFTVDMVQLPQPSILAPRWSVNQGERPFLARNNDHAQGN
jgi:hypothetical protein